MTTKSKTTVTARRTAKNNMFMLTNNNFARASLACVQTSPISFVARGKGSATKEIGDVCTQASASRYFVHLFAVVAPLRHETS